MLISREQIACLLIGFAYLTVILNAPFITFGIKYVYLLVFILLLVFLFLGKFQTRNIYQFSLHLIYIFIMFLFLVITVVFLDGDDNSLIAFGLYTLPIIIWAVFYSERNSISFDDIFVSTYKLTAIVGYLGIIQYFFSPNLFGFIPTNSMAIEWAMDKSFVEYAVFFRATSTLGSPQVFGLFCALNLILTLRYKHLLSKKMFYIGCIGLFIGGALTGNKSFFLIVLIYLLTMITLKQVINNIRYVFIVLFLIVLSVINYQEIVSKVPMLERVFSISQIVNQESNTSDSRLDRYAYILTNSNPFVGEGLGTITNKSTKELKAAESYILKIYYEGGAFAMAWFLLLCSFSYFQARRVDKRDGTIVALTVLGMVVVHAFESPSFFIIWGHFLAAIALKKEKRSVHYGY